MFKVNQFVVVLILVLFLGASSTGFVWDKSVSNAYTPKNTNEQLKHLKIFPLNVESSKKLDIRNVNNIHNRMDNFPISNNKFITDTQGNKLNSSLFTNLSSYYENNFNRTILGIGYMISNSSSILYVPELGNCSYSFVSIFNGNSAHTFDIKNDDICNVYSLNNGYLLEAKNLTSSNEGQIIFYIINFNGYKEIDLRSINTSMVGIVSTIGDMIYLNYISENSTYLLAFYENGTLDYNLTKLANIPTYFSTCDIITYQGLLFLGGSIYKNESMYYAFGSINLSTNKYTLLKKWGILNERNNNYGEAISNMFQHGNKIFLFGERYYFYIADNGANASFASLGYNLSVFNMTSGNFSSYSPPVPNNSIFGTFNGNGDSLVGNFTFLYMEDYNQNYTEMNQSYSYNYEILLNVNSLKFENITDNFSSNFPINGATSWKGNFYISAYNAGIPGNPTIIEYNLTTGMKSIPSFISSTGYMDYPRYWNSQSVQGDGGIMTVGGNGFVFYNKTGIYTNGTIENSGFLISGAFQDNEFLMVGQDYFPEEGIIAYLYYPSNNSVDNVTSSFAKGLSENATLFSVSPTNGGFIVEGIMETTTKGLPLLYYYNTTYNKVTNLSSDFPSWLSGVSGGQTAYSAGYTYIAYKYQGGIWVSYYHDNYMNIKGSNVTGNFNPLQGQYSPYRFDFMVANGTYLCMFGSTGIDYDQLEEIGYSADHNLITLGSTITKNSGMNYQYAILYGGNALILGDETSSGDTFALEYKSYNSNFSSAFSSNYLKMDSHFGSIFSASEFNSSIFISAGSFSNLLFGTWDLNLSNFNIITYGVTFEESGLPSGTTWYVNLSNEIDSGAITGSSYSLSLPNGTYTYEIATSNPEYKPTAYTGSATVNGSAVSESVQFSQITYPVTFTETGLPSGTTWYVNLSNGTDSGAITGSSYSLSLPNGAYTYTVSTSDKAYKPNIKSSSFTVNGTNISFSFYFGMPYSVTFTESNLPSGNTWYVNLSNGIDSGAITGTSYTFSLVNGSYTYTVSTSDHEYAPGAYSGSVTVSGKSASVSIAFSEVTYSVTFTETGLPSGTTWYVNLSSGADSGAITGTSYSLSLPNGTYTYTISTSDHYFSPNVYSGSVKVSGSSKSEAISFSLVTYSVTFTETGIESGQSWNVDINGFTHTISGLSFTIFGTNGTFFKYSIMNSSSYYTTGVTSGVVNINGKDITVTLSFEHYAYIVGSFNQTNVNVTVNGENFTVTSGKFMYKTTTGTYSVEISEKGYIPVYRNFTLQPGQTVNISANLEKVPAQNSDDIYYVIGGFIAVIVTASAVIVYIRKLK